jgi:acyl carrier protein
MTIETNLASRQATREATARQCETDAQDALERFLRQHIPAATARPLNKETPLLASGLLDSLGVLQLVAFLADELGVEIGDEDFSEENFGTVGGLLALVLRKRSGRG